MNDLSKYNDDELATWQASYKQNSPQFILGEKEWDKRLMSHQFALQSKLVATNNRWMMACAIIGLVATILGTILGWYLSSQ